MYSFLLVGLLQMAGMENTVGFISSGTAMEPKSTIETDPMIHHSLRDWVFMFHGKAFVWGIQQTGPRGADRFLSTNWMMPMLVRKAGVHTFSVRSMLSIEPTTVTNRRYPMLFQTGETAFGQPIVDGQHPHDLIMELAGRYDLSFNDRAELFVYGGPVAEPAFGPPAFPHRSSASENPFAVLGHHQQDSTHLANSVITLGFAGGPFQIEASGFHGREPNENRWNIDSGKPDSFAARLTFSPYKHLTGQVSHGRINEREALEPGLDTIRTTASVHHHVPFEGGHIASSLIWGRNKDVESHGKRVFNAYTLESTVNFLSRNWVWTRIENVDRDATLLGEDEENPIGRVQAYTFGYERELPSPIPGVRLGLGAQLTAYGLNPELKAVYGDRPLSTAFFLRLRPKGNVMSHTSTHQHE